MSSNPTSFLSEHSAEYALVRDLAHALSPDFDCIVPIYFWTTREGSAIAARSVGSRAVRIITAYPRRPKLLDPGDTTIVMKVNAMLLKAGAAGCELGIPVFVGVPRATELLQYTLDTPCSWFHLAEHKPPENDVEIRVSVDGNSAESDVNPRPVSGPLTTNDLRAVVQRNSRPMAWGQAVESIREVRGRGEFGQRAFFWSGYRPFYFLLPE